MRLSAKSQKKISHYRDPISTPNDYNQLVGKFNVTIAALRKIDPDYLNAGFFYKGQSLESWILAAESTIRKNKDEKLIAEGYSLKSLYMIEAVSIIRIALELPVSSDSSLFVGENEKLTDALRKAGVSLAEFRRQESVIEQKPVKEWAFLWDIHYLEHSIFELATADSSIEEIEHVTGVLAATYEFHEDDMHRNILSKIRERLNGLMRSKYEDGYDPGIFDFQDVLVSISSGEPLQEWSIKNIETKLEYWTPTSWRNLFINIRMLEYLLGSFPKETQKTEIKDLIFLFRSKFRDLLGNTDYQKDFENSLNELPIDWSSVEEMNSFANEISEYNKDYVTMSVYVEISKTAMADKIYLYSEVLKETILSIELNSETKASFEEEIRVDIEWLKEWGATDLADEVRMVLETRLSS